ncbi:MAG TPA: hypothetical protein VL866_24335 [Pyrinomonadaceae bacterium]|nr:hypothetical protein [Pyrinomonadaceae bacterium]
MHNRKNFAIGSLVAKSEDTRFSLATVQIHRDKTVACDGHVLALVSNTETENENFPLIDNVTPLAEFEPFLIPAAQAAAIVKAIPNERQLPALNHALIGVNGDGQSKVIATTDLETKTVFKVDESPQPPSKQFPKWEKAIPDGEPVAVATLDLNLLLPALKAMAAFGPDRTKSVTMRVYKSEHDKPDRSFTPVRFDARNWDTGQHMTVVAMPMNDVIEAKDWTTASEKESHD